MLEGLNSEPPADFSSAVHILVDDPHELHELSPDPARAATLREHRALLAEWEAGLVEVPEAAASYDVAAARARDEE